MSNYIGIHTQIARNNRLSVFYLIAFPLLVLLPVFLVTFVLPFLASDDNGMSFTEYNPFETFLSISPIV
jgi:hypothetical protein